MGPAHFAPLPQFLGVLLYGAQLSALVKGAGHKYIRRVPTGDPRRPWRYYYRVTGGAHLGHDSELVEGAAFRVKHDGKEGHFHITKVDGDTLIVKHDESGRTETLTRAAFRELLHTEHVESIRAARDTAKRVRAEAEKHGSDMQKYKARTRHAELEEAFAPPRPVTSPKGPPVQFKLSQRAKDNGQRLLKIDLRRFDAAWSKDKSYYVGPGGTGAAIGGASAEGRYAQFGEWLKRGEAVEASEVGVNAAGVPGFTNGRHRLAWLRDHGYMRAYVSVDPEDYARMKELFGPKRVAKREKPTIDQSHWRRVDRRGQSIELTPKGIEAAWEYGAGVTGALAVALRTFQQENGTIPVARVLHNGKTLRTGGGSIVTSDVATELERRGWATEQTTPATSMVGARPSAITKELVQWVLTAAGKKAAAAGAAAEADMLAELTGLRPGGRPDSDPPRPTAIAYRTTAPKRV